MHSTYEMHAWICRRSPASNSSSKQETIGLLLMWLHGYLNDDDSPPVIDFDKITKDGEKLAAYCATRPTDGLMTSAEQVLD